MTNSKLWPRFLCKRDKDGAITEEKQFNTPDSVPAGEGWEPITPPDAPAPKSASTEELERRAAVAEGAARELAGKVAELEKMTGKGAPADLKKALAEISDLKAANAALQEEIATLKAPAPPAAA